MKNSLRGFGIFFLLALGLPSLASAECFFGLYRYRNSAEYSAGGEGLFLDEYSAKPGWLVGACESAKARCEAGGRPPRGGIVPGKNHERECSFPQKCVCRQTRVISEPTPTGPVFYCSYAFVIWRGATPERRPFWASARTPNHRMVCDAAEATCNHERWKYETSRRSADPESLKCGYAGSEERQF